MPPINCTVPDEVMSKLRKRHQILRPGLVFDHPGFQFGDEGAQKRRKKRKDHQRVVPTKRAREVRRWRRGRVKIEIEWKLHGSYGVGGDEEERTVTAEDVEAIEADIQRFTLKTGMEDTVKSLVEVLKKAREPPKSANQDKKNFHPRIPYDQIRENIRAIVPKSGIKWDRIEECSHDKVIFHLVGQELKGYGNKQTEGLQPEVWAAVEVLIGEVCRMDVVDYVTGIKQQESK